MKKFKTVLWWVSRNLNAIMGFFSFIIAVHISGYIEKDTQIYYAAMYVTWFLLGIYGVLLHVVTTEHAGLATLSKKLHKKENE